MDKPLFFWLDFHIDFSRSVLLAAGLKYEAPFTRHSFWGRHPQNFGTSAVNVGHGLRPLHDKYKLDLFQC